MSKGNLILTAEQNKAIITARRQRQQEVVQERSWSALVQAPAKTEPVKRTGEFYKAQKDAPKVTQEWLVEHTENRASLRAWEIETYRKLRKDAKAKRKPASEHWLRRERRERAQAAAYAAATGGAA